MEGIIDLVKYRRQEYVNRDVIQTLLDEKEWKNS